MKVLTASAGERPGDFSFTVPGELVYVGPVCGKDRGGGTDCGCGRAFSGSSTGRGTTVAVVVDLDTTLDDLTTAIRDHLLAAGWTDVDIWARELAEDMAEEADTWPEGTRLRRLVDEVRAE